MSRGKNTKIGNTGTKIGKYVNYQRMKRELSLNELGKQTGMATSFLLRLERGVYQNVKFDVIEKLAEGFDMTIEDFLIKCGIIEESHKLPPLEYYLKEQYQLPPEAISDTKLFIELLKMKYKKEIQHMKTLHKSYWKNKK